jgi:hypothetical protein
MYIITRLYKTIHIVFSLALFLLLSFSINAQGKLTIASPLPTVVETSTNDTMNLPKSSIDVETITSGIESHDIKNKFSHPDKPSTPKFGKNEINSK